MYCLLNCSDRTRNLLMSRKDSRGRRHIVLSSYEPILNMVYGKNLPVKQVAALLGCSTKNIYFKLKYFDAMVEFLVGQKVPAKPRTRSGRKQKKYRNILGKYEDILRLRYREGKECREIAATLNLPFSTAYSKVSRLLREVERLFSK